MKNKEFNVTQGMALLLLKPLNLPANYVLNLIIILKNERFRVACFFKQKNKRYNLKIPTIYYLINTQ